MKDTRTPSQRWRICRCVGFNFYVFSHCSAFSLWILRLPQNLVKLFFLTRKNILQLIRFGSCRLAQRESNVRAMSHALRVWRDVQPAGENTLAAVGALLGLSAAQVYRYEQGINRIPAESVSRISRLTGISPAILRPDLFADDQALAG
jgi:DNA-binding transcriptional regulator YdaS (Cro superfamily)